MGNKPCCGISCTDIVTEQINEKEQIEIKDSLELHRNRGPLSKNIQTNSSMNVSKQLAYN